MNAALQSSLAVTGCIRGNLVDPVVLLQELIRFPTENPPGDVRACVGFIQEVLGLLGIDSTIYARDAMRPNLVARLPGRGVAPPLLLTGHIDVVPVSGQRWTVDPFAGLMKDGFIWGRGALDMKGGLAMLIAAFVAMRDSPPPGDVVLCVLCDEETGGQNGAGFLVDDHPELFAGVRHAIGEFGGFSFDLFGSRFVPIQVDERQFVGITANIFEAGGHAALKGTANAAVSAARFVQKVSSLVFPIVETVPTKRMLRTMASSVGPVASAALRLLGIPKVAPLIIRVLGDRASALSSCMASSVTVTMIQCGTKRNVVPSIAVVEMDARLVPGDSLENILERLRKLAPFGTKFTVHAQPRQKSETDMSQYERLEALLRKEYPGVIPVPMLLPGTTDARHFNRLDIQTYGFLPVAMPKGMAYMALIHGTDERIPVEALHVGARLIESYVSGYQG
ncbi:MAG: M20/M25/M40 family metallo-hydrolase [Ramlibacter sp.]|nr:M20/M25/M40 family metallo-hydrolase [Ramlibacter sp.]